MADDKPPEEETSPTPESPDPTADNDADEPDKEKLGQVPNDPHLWPNGPAVVDGVTPTDAVSQDPALFDNDTDEDLEREMTD